MSILHFIVRWFGLDTIACVIAIQFFLARYTGMISYSYIFGLCCVVGLVYMLDRYRDLQLRLDFNQRHLVYKHNVKWLLLSIVILGSYSILFWTQLPVIAQWIFLGCCFIGILHLWLLKFGWYYWVKDGLVAIIFSIIMVLNYDQSMYVALLIGIFALFNLTSHRLIETGMQSFDYVWVSSLIIGLLGVIISQFGLTWSLIIWIFSIVGHLYLIYKGRQFKWWYEIGELLFLIPFILQPIK